MSSFGCLGSYRIGKQLLGLKFQTIEDDSRKLNEKNNQKKKPDDGSRVQGNYGNFCNV